MNLQSFIDKWNGKGADFDGSYGNQCFDLYRFYCKEVLNIPQSPPTGTKGAVTIADNYLSEYLDKFLNTPEGYPQSGDIMIWGKDYGPYGHVAIVTEANVKNFVCFSQNDPEGTLCGIKKYNSYKGVICWLRIKGQPSQPIDNMQDKILKKYNVKDESELDRKIEEHVGTSWGGESNGGYLGSARKENRDLKAQVDGLTQNSSDLRESHSTFVRRIIDKINPFLGLPNASDEERAIDAVERIVSENSSLVSELKNSQKAFSEREKNLLDENRTLHSELDKLQDEIDAMKIKHSDDILQLEKRLENAKQSIDTHNEQKDDFEVLKQLWNKIMSVFQKGKDEKVKKVSAKRGRPKKVA